MAEECFIIGRIETSQIQAHKAINIIRRQEDKIPVAIQFQLFRFYKWDPNYIKADALLTKNAIHI